jgi:CubicO group peptidase (beta-lactamase class C family)
MVLSSFCAKNELTCLMAASTIREIAATNLNATLAGAVEAGLLAHATGIVATGDDVLYEGAHGYRDVASATPMTLDTVCWIGSCSKAITAIACMQLVEQGRLDLDEPIGKVLPELSNPQVLLEVQQGVPVMRPAVRPITLQHLMTHTAGFTYSIWNGLMADYEVTTGTPFIQECKEASLRVPLVFDPGSRWEYGISMEWVGKAIERVAGVSLETYVRENILEPLGMRDTGFTREPHHRQKQATVYFRELSGRLVRFPWAIPDDAEFFMGGGGMFSTTSDFSKILRLLLGAGTLAGTPILRRETVRKMMRNHIGDLEVRTLELPESGPGADGGRVAGFDGPLTGAFNAFPGKPHKWTLSFDTNLEPLAGGRAAHSISWVAAQNIYWWVDPNSGIAGLFLTQLFPFPDEPTLAIKDAFERAAYELLATYEPVRPVTA